MEIFYSQLRIVSTISAQVSVKIPVRATAVGRDAVLAGDPKKIRLICNTTLITDIPSRGSKEERIRIHLLVWANIRNNGYKR